jgi:hypothetical protein
MKLQEAKEAFYDASGTLSENARKLAFVGIAIVWIFKTGDKGAAGISFSGTLLWPLGAFICALILDMSQYLYKSTAWWIYYAIKHRQGVSDDEEVHPSGILNFFNGVFFYAKVGCVGYAYYELFRFVWHAIASNASLKV